MCICVIFVSPIGGSSFGCVYVIFVSPIGGSSFGCVYVLSLYHLLVGVVLDVLYVYKVSYIERCGVVSCCASCGLELLLFKAEPSTQEQFYFYDLFLKLYW